MRALVATLLLAGCYDYDRLERLYGAGGGGDGGSVALDGGHALDGPSERQDLADPHAAVADFAQPPNTDLTPPCEGTRCDGQCVNLDEDPRNCGACGRDCTALPGVSPTLVQCVSGDCVLAGACRPGRGDCTAADGCETDLTTPSSCGLCGMTCGAATPLCSSTTGSFSCVSVCPGGTPTQCGSSCVDTTSNPDHCGGCPTVCPLPVGAIGRSCVASQCGFTCSPDRKKQGDSCVLKTLQKQTISSTTILHQVWGSSAADVWIAGDQIILHSTGNGSWEERTGDAPDGNWHSVWGTGPSNVYAAGTAGIIRSTDGGVHWTQLYSAAHVEIVWGSAASDIYGVTRTDQVLRSKNGTSFSPATVPGTWWAVWGSGASNVFIGGVSNGVDQFLVASSPGNDSWAGETKGYSTVWAGWSPSPSLVYAVGNFGYILRRGGDGVWRQQSNQQMGGANIGVWGSGVDDVWAVGIYGVVQRSTDATSWQKITSNTMAKLRSVWGSGRGDVYIVGDAGTILHLE